MAVEFFYDYLFQFDGNLTDDSANAVVLGVDSGTPAYVTGDSGQAFQLGSAELSATVPNHLTWDQSFGLYCKLKVSTGATDGLIFAIDNGTKPVFQFGIKGSNYYWVSFRGSGSQTAGTRPITFDTWDATGVSWASSLYLETEGAGTGTATNYITESNWAYGTSNDWDDREELRLLIGQFGNTNTGSGTFSAGTVATGVEIDWLAGSQLNEGKGNTKPLDGEYGPRTARQLPTSFSVTDPQVSTVALNTSSFSPPTLVGPTGGGPSGPIIKEFWS